jgi:hypothetical protein
LIKLPKGYITLNRASKQTSGKSSKRSGAEPNPPFALPHFGSEIFQLFGLPVGVLDLVDLLEPVSAANSSITQG